MTDAVGWAAALILLATIGRQVYTQWRDATAEGVSRWLFIGQIAASAGFTLYSLLVHSAVFVFTNSAMLLTAILGLIIDHRNRRRVRNPAPLTEAPAE